MISQGLSLLLIIYRQFLKNKSSLSVCNYNLVSGGLTQKQRENYSEGKKTTIFKVGKELREAVNAGRISSRQAGRTQIAEHIKRLKVITKIVGGISDNRRWQRCSST